MPNVETKAQTQYAEDFTTAVVRFLAFHPSHAELGMRLARVVAEHATPVGSGTVARTKRISHRATSRSRGHRLDATSDDRL